MMMIGEPSGREPVNHHRHWKPEEVDTVRQLEQQGVNRKVIARQFDRTPDSIRRLCVRRAIRRIEWPLR